MKEVSNASFTTNAVLKGLPGISNDVRDCSGARPSCESRARSLRVPNIALVGMLVAAMGGIDGLVFTAGIGENAPPFVRPWPCA